MYLWQFVLKADDERDLADPGTGFDWFKDQDWIVELEKWTADQRKEWTINVHVLRSLVRRLTDERPKQTAFKGAESVGVKSDLDSFADNRFETYLGRLRIFPRNRHRAKGEWLPLTRKSYEGLGVRPTKVTAAGEREILLRPSHHLTDLDVFWQVVFFGLVSDDMTPVCESCGKVLERSKGGKLSRRRKCPGCNRRAWESRQSKAAIRLKWKRDKKRQRG